MSEQGLPFKDAILDTALALAAERGWSRIHLHQIAERLEVPLGDIAAVVPDLDAVGDHLFARARDAMLARGQEPGIRALPSRERIAAALMAWLDALAPHRATARDILMYKLAPVHVHHQAALIVAVSRTVQWLREAAGLSASGFRRSREEARLTLLFTAMLGLWFGDRSPNQARTKSWLRRRLQISTEQTGDIHKGVTSVTES
jgi:AcrR family transcriptional regulator